MLYRYDDDDDDDIDDIDDDDDDDDDGDDGGGTAIIRHKYPNPTIPETLWKGIDEMEFSEVDSSLEVATHIGDTVQECHIDWGFLRKRLDHDTRALFIL
jgi:hypothetical protein